MRVVAEGGEHGKCSGGAAERQPGSANQSYGEVEDGEVVVPAAGRVEFFWAVIGAGAGRWVAASWASSWETRCWSCSACCRWSSREVSRSRTRIWRVLRCALRCVALAFQASRDRTSLGMRMRGGVWKWVAVTVCCDAFMVASCLGLRNCSGIVKPNRIPRTTPTSDQPGLDVDVFMTPHK